MRAKARVEARLSLCILSCFGTGTCSIIYSRAYRQSLTFYTYNPHYHVVVKQEE